jgi:hypothetical protein
MGRLSIDITADDQADGDLAARLVAATFNTHGFDDVTNNSHPTHLDREEEVIEAMRTLNPAIFQSEVTIDVSTFEEAPALAGADVPGDDEFPDVSEEDDDGDIDILEEER